MKSSDVKNDGTVFSYGVPGNGNEIIIYNYKNFHIFVKELTGKKNIFPVFRWHVLFCNLLVLKCQGFMTEIFFNWKYTLLRELVRNKNCDLNSTLRWIEEWGTANLEWGGLF